MTRHIAASRWRKDHRGSGLLEGRSITVIGAGTQRSRDPDVPIGNGRAIAVRAAARGLRSSASTGMKRRHKRHGARSSRKAGTPRS